MVYDDQDDLFVEDFDFVDEDEEDNAPVEETQQEPIETAGEPADKPSDQASTPSSPAKPRRRNSSRGGKRGARQKSAPEAQGSAETEEQAEKVEPSPVEEPKEPAVPTDHVVHIYELGQFKRTINREFTSDDAEAFVVEYNRTSGAHSRQAVAAGRDDKPAETL